MSGCQRLDTLDRQSMFELFVNAYIHTTYAPAKYSVGQMSWYKVEKE